jgi:thiamine-phosphate pyrophosphorylase
MEDFGLYVVMTSPLAGYYALMEACIREGVRMVQLRDKGMSDRELFTVARDLADMTAGSATKLIINDRIDVALACGAQGLHLGQEDLPLDALTPIRGAILAGLSTHSRRQALDALMMDPDYIAFGPVYSTPAKLGRDPVTGTGFLPELVSLSRIPVVAIGGINEENIRTVLSSGARNAAVIRAVDTMNPGDAIRRLMDIMNEQAAG